jgi:hypothetical protein
MQAKDRLDAALSTRRLEAREARRVGLLVLLDPIPPVDPCQ